MCTNNENSFQKIRKQDLARQDYNRVVGEIHGRRTCRSAVFLATLGAMGTAGYALIAMIQAGDSMQWKKWLILGTLLPLFVLTVSIVITIYKARTINLRTGYLGALEYYMYRGKTPLHFGGWQNAFRAADMCVKKMHADKKPPCDKEKQKRCITQARNKADKTNKEVKMWRIDLLKSFTALSTLTYGLLYLIVGTSSLSKLIM